MKSLFAFPIIAALSGAAVYGNYPAHVPSLQAEVLNATVRIEVRNDKNALGAMGSGTAIGKRHILTNHHVVASAVASGSISVRGWIREGDRLLPVMYAAKIISMHKGRDLALLELDADWIGAIGELADAEPEETARVCKSGAQGGRRPRVACGEWFGHDEKPSGEITHVSSGAATAPGDSGGGVWSVHEGNYRIIAVTRAVPMIPMGMGATLVTTTGLAISLADVRAFIEGALNADASAE